MIEMLFDARDGTLVVGEAAIALRMEQSIPGDLIPLQDLLLAEELPVDPNEYTRQHRAEWTPNDFAALGSVTLTLLKNTSPDNAWSRLTMYRLYELGLGPNPRRFIGNGQTWQTTEEMRAELGYPLGRKAMGKFNAWTREDYVRYAAEVERVTGNKPTRPDYAQYARDNPHAPGIQLLCKTFAGGISELNEHLGYPNVKTWDEDDYIEYGTRFIEVNGAALLNLSGVNTLSVKRRGPGYNTIWKKFGSWETYKSRVIEAYQDKNERREFERRNKLKGYHELIDNGELPAEYGELSDDELLTYGARHSVATSLAPRLTPLQLKAIVEAKSSRSFVSTLIKSLPHKDLSAGYIELEASILDVYDDLWPMDQYKQYLTITPEDLLATQERINEAQRIFRKRRRQRAAA